MPQSLRPCLRFSFVVNRLTMSLSERPCDQKSISRKHDSLALNPLLMNCPDARSWFQHYTSACIPTLLSLAQRGLVDDMYSVAHSALHRVCNILFWCPEIGSKAGEKTLDESGNCCYECVERPRQTPAAQIQESSQVGEHQVHHARLEKRHWSNSIRKSAGCIEGTILAKRRGSLRTPHHADPDVSHETCHH